MRLFLVVAAIALGFQASSQAWDFTGHMLVDQVAYDRVNPEVRDRVAALAGLLETKYNAHQPYNFITAGCWMDDMRSSPNYAWSKWHYMDSPYTSDASKFSVAEPPHVLWAITQAIDTIKNPASTEPQKAEALAMIIHFVGDVHQPMHCVSWDDKGGNGYLIYGIPFSDLSKKRPGNLHAFWDKAFRFDVKNGKVVELYWGLWTSERPHLPDEGRIKEEAEKIVARFPVTAFAEKLKVKDRVEWARESYVQACKAGYPPGPHPTETEVVTLKPEFVHASHEIACERVALAGYRLADLLNSLF